MVRKWQVGCLMTKPFHCSYCNRVAVIVEMDCYYYCSNCYYMKFVLRWRWQALCGGIILYAGKVWVGVIPRKLFQTQSEEPYLVKWAVSCEAVVVRSRHRLASDGLNHVLIFTTVRRCIDLLANEPVPFICRSLGVANPKLRPTGRWGNNRI